MSIAIKGESTAFYMSLPKMARKLHEAQDKAQNQQPSLDNANFSQPVNSSYPQSNSTRAYLEGRNRSRVLGLDESPDNHSADSNRPSIPYGRRAQITHDVIGAIIDLNC